MVIVSKKTSFTKYLRHSLWSYHLMVV